MVQPIKNNVLVKPFPSDEVSEGGIFVSEAHREISSKVHVMSVGNGTAKTPMKFKKGDVAFRIKGCGDALEIDGELYYLVQQSWLIAKLD